MIFKRLPDGYSEILPAWNGETVAILAPGPSLTREQCEYVRGRTRTIAINGVYLTAPWADVLWFGDERWLNQFGHTKRPEFHAFRGEVGTIEEKGKAPGDERFHLFRNADDHLGLSAEGFSEDSRAVVTGRSSGRAAINVAALAGAARIVLFGYDFRTVNGRDHCAGAEHPIPTTELDLKAQLTFYRTLGRQLQDRGIEVVNATPGSRLDTFPRVPLDLVRWLERAAA